MNHNHSKPLKLAYRFAILLAVFSLGFIIYGLYSFKTLNELKVNGSLYQRIEKGKDLLADILPPPLYVIEPYLVVRQIIEESEKDKQNALIEKLMRLKKEYDTRYSYWKTQNLQAIFPATLFTDSDTAAKEFYKLSLDELVPAIQKGDKASIEKLLPKINTTYETHRKAVDIMVQIINKQSTLDQDKGLSEVRDATIWQLLILLVSIAIAWFVALIMTRSILKSLGGEPELASQLTRAIAHGDLSVEIPVKANDTQSLIANLVIMQKALRDLILQIQNAVEHMFSAANELSKISTSVAESASNQSDAASSTAASVEEVVVSIGHIAESAEKANEISREAEILLTQGQSLFRSTIAEIKQIASSVESSTKEMYALGEQSNKISSIINVINEIADQTNLLALNAAIEAARAGEAGRGFAVVADEVRKLAEKTRLSTHETTLMVNAIQLGTQTTVHEMEIGVKKVEGGVETADKANHSMEQIEVSVRRVLAAVNEISLGLGEQRTANNEIANNVEIIARMAEESSSAVVNVSTSVNNMLELATTLKAQANRFKL